MKTMMIRNKDRGEMSFGWLQARYTFNFANYYHPERKRFGKLRVLNDDIIGAGTGFDTHPHDNMEIVTIPLEGGLRHKDSTGTEGVIRAGDVQVMSAGTGILHSEHNASKTEVAKVLQIWVFPKKVNVPPRYDQKTFAKEDYKNRFALLVSPDGSEESLKVYQDVYFQRGQFSQHESIEYQMKKKGNGAYLFLLEGEISIAGKILNRRDSIGISETESFTIELKKPSDILLIDVPM